MIDAARPLPPGWAHGAPHGLKLAKGKLYVRAVNPNAAGLQAFMADRGYALAPRFGRRTVFCLPRFLAIVGTMAFPSRSPLALAAAVSVLAVAAHAHAQDPAVAVSTLAPPDLFSNPAADTGLPGDLWKDASPGLMRETLPKLGAKPLSPAFADFARRVLATGARAPAGVGDDPEMGGARALALIALGEAAGAKRVMDRTPGLDQNAALAMAAAEANLIAGDDDRACAVADALSADRGTGYWLRLRAFCQARAGQTAEAQLTFNLAQQQGKDADYARLMPALLSGAAPTGGANLRTGINYALSKKLGLDIQAAAATATPATRPLLAPPAADLAAAQAADWAFLKSAKPGADFAAAARAAAPLIAAMVAADAPLTDPGLFLRAALTAGDVKTAQAIRGKMTGDAIPGVGNQDLALFDAALAASSGGSTDQALDRLVELGASGGAKSPAQPAAVVLQALGGTLSPEDRATFAGFEGGKSNASAARLALLDAAAVAGRKGEAAVLALSVAADAGVAGPSAADRARIVAALNRAGLSADARALAVEGLLPAPPAPPAPKPAAKPAAKKK